tara:strand:- start:335 stop:490 length:156 start_codon:yes stop_codon:yes gene_type:complete
MLGHDDPRVEMEPKLGPSMDQVVPEGVLDQIVLKEWKSPIAGESDKSNVIR